MPVTVTVDHARQRVLVRCDGVVTSDDVERHLQVEEQERGMGYPELFDARGCGTDLTLDEVRTLVRRVHALVRSHPDFGPTAIVADSDVAYGMARMFAILSEATDGGVGPPIEVFRDAPEAEQWLRDDSHGTGERAT